MSLALDRDGLHWLLWQRQDGADQVVIDQKRLAAELGVNRFTVNRVLARMQDEGRLRKLTPGATGRGARSYEVFDPAVS